MNCGRAGNVSARIPSMNHVVATPSAFSEVSAVVHAHVLSATMLLEEMVYAWAVKLGLQSTRH